METPEIPKNIPFLFYANKSDVKGACSSAEVEEILKLRSINREYRVFSCSGLSGQGVEAGVNWLSLALKPRLENR